MESQLQQICFGSDPTSRISRRHLGYTGQFQISVRTKMPNATQCITKTDFAWQVVSQTGPVPNGKTQFRLVCRPQREATLSHNTIPQSASPNISTAPTVHNTGTGSCRDEMVDEGSVQLVTTACGTNCISADDRCIRDRMGSPTRTDKNVWTLDRSPEVLACQLQGTLRRSCCNLTKPTPIEELARPIADRQLHSHGLHQQRGRNEVEEAPAPDTSAPGTLGQSRGDFNGKVPSRSLQHGGGCTISQQEEPRMAPSSSSDEENFREVGYSGGRPICLQDRSCSAGLYFGRPRGQTSSISQCLSQTLELPPRMVISTTKSYTSGASTSQYSQRSIHPYSSVLGKSLLESRHTTKNRSNAVPNTGPTTGIDRYENGTPSPGYSQHILGGMADTRWADLVADWTTEEKALLLILSSWRKSTMKTYMAAWSKWKSWCSQQSLDFRCAEPSVVARYLAYLHNTEGLAYRTILVHKSAISTLAKSNNQDVSSNFLVRQTLKAISVAKLKNSKPPIWNPKTVLDYLISKNSDEQNLYQVSRRVAILLLLASGRRVHDLTLLKIGPEHLMDEGDSLILWPDFGSKTDTAEHRQSGWRLEPHPELNLNILYWIRILLKVSEQRRREGDWKELFISTRGVSKPATRTMIGGWVKNVLREAGVEAPPGSVRSAVSSLNWIENYTMDQILSTGNWKQEHTFRTYYHRQIKDMERKTCNLKVSLSKYFKSV
ncbi:PREDICTED: uncharacterized protein LOC106106759 [Papilio polytes]|uniref:uncharacterized protein LOC106106759 n=1 Tax=Papilio polytes TaxID=76194 RepID=UPI0006760603|nr:PREDICTED: uncharacterized protein LOC106106759 [Papilio polytes]